MRALTPVAAAVFLVACGTNQQTSTKSTSPANPAQAPKPDKTTETPKTVAADQGPSPVEFNSLGLAPDKQSFSYRIKVNTDKPIAQVDLAFKGKDDNGKVVDETTIIWQNIVKSKRQPIEKGKTYEDQSTLMPGVTQVECSIKRVVFKDQTTWLAPAS